MAHTHKASGAHTRRTRDKNGTVRSEHFGPGDFITPTESELKAWPDKFKPVNAPREDGGKVAKLEARIKELEAENKEIAAAPQETAGSGDGEAQEKPKGPPKPK